MRHWATAAALGALALLAGCTHEHERTAGGAAAAPPGIALGGLAGTGAPTTPKDVNLGKRPWADNEPPVPRPGGQGAGSY